MNLFWGDLHSHCSVSYGAGSVGQALARARGQLDFCSITGHAFWPDMPSDRERYGEIIDYHREGFARLARNWDGLLAEQAAASRDGDFLALPSYEWHSLEYGDHNVYAAGPELPLRDAPDLPSLGRLAQDSHAILVPHHVAYAAGYRGIDWRHFDAGRSPLVEIFSLHGCGESEEAPYPMLHDMGPRDWGSTAAAGWALGHRFGVIASTDHHGGYPGSHGDGRLAVFAERLTRASLWQALLARRTYAVTGDKIDARLSVEDAWIGEEIRAAGPRYVRVDVRGSDALDYVEVLKNDVLLRRMTPPRADVGAGRQTFRLRLTWGWGRKNEPVRWTLQLTLDDGAVTAVEPCFSGQAVVAPQGVAGHTDAADEEDLPHEIVERGARSVTCRSITTGNRSTRHATTQAISLEVEATLQTRVVVEANGVRIEHRLGDLLRKGRAHYLRGWLSEALRIGPLVPLAECCLHAEFPDAGGGDDRYRLRVAQRNGQWAWLSPIWVDRA